MGQRVVLILHFVYVNSHVSHLVYFRQHTLLSGLLVLTITAKAYIFFAPILYFN